MAGLARLEERTDHIQRDVTEIKGDIRRLDSKVDTIGGKLAELSERFGAMQASMMRWSLGMVIAVATLVYGIARFVK